MSGLISVGVRGLLFGAAASFSITGTTDVAFAAGTAPHVDLTQPHTQLYPESAQAGGEEGTVLVSVYVQPDGKITKYKVAQSSGFSDLDTAALQSVLNWRFVPATRNGDPIPDWTMVKVVYQLPHTAQPPG